MPPERVIESYVSLDGVARAADVFSNEVFKEVEQELF